MMNSTLQKLVNLFKQKHSNEAIKQQTAHLFEEKQNIYANKLPPSVHLELAGLNGGFIQNRVKSFQSANYSLALKTGSPYSELSAKVYKLKRIIVTSVVVATYANHIVLWLDDHYDDSDFETFIHRENLLFWLPGEIDKLAQLLVETVKIRQLR